jgi:hypothetical protein
MHATTAAKILGVTLSEAVQPTSAMSRVPAAASVKLAQEIVAAGYTKHWIEEELSAPMLKALYGLAAFIRADYAEGIRALHDRLWEANEVGWQRSNHGTIIYGKRFREVCRCYRSVALDPATVRKRAERKRRRGEA